MKKESPLVSVTVQEIFPDKVEAFKDLIEQNASLNKSVAPLRLIAIPEKETGNGEVVMIHYFKGGEKERKQVVEGMKSSNDWQEFVKSADPYTLCKKSTIFKEATAIQNSDKAAGLEPFAAEALNIDSPGVIEVKRANFQIKQGGNDDASSKFLAMYKKGVAAKAAAPDIAPSTALVTVLFSKQNDTVTVMEIWRHDNQEAMEQSKTAMQNCEEWKKTAAIIKKNASKITNNVFKPLSFSPIR